jgi:hypothetical protein
MHQFHQQNIRIHAIQTIPLQLPFHLLMTPLLIGTKLLNLGLRLRGGVCFAISFAFLIHTAMQKSSVFTLQQKKIFWNFCHFLSKSG